MKQNKIFSLPLTLANYQISIIGNTDGSDSFSAVKAKFVNIFLDVVSGFL